MLSLPCKFGGIMSFKKCNECDKVKPLTEYYKQVTSKDGKAYKCKVCAYITKKQWNKDNPEKYKAQITRRKFSPGWPYSYSRKRKIEKQRQDRKNLADNYVKQLITSKGTIGQNINKDNISQELIDAYRVQILLKRELKLVRPLEIDKKS